MVNDVPSPLVPSHKSLVTSYHSLPNPELSFLRYNRDRCKNKRRNHYES